MMACVADKLVASPFAVLGSIGVITEQPNVYERLKREGVQFSTITAGKFKRTLTPTKKIDEKDLKKQQDDIEQVLKLFKGFVASNRPAVDIETIATGETWFGPDALERNMVDHLATVDDVLLGYVDEGAQVYGVKYTEKPPSPLAALGIGGDMGGGGGSTSWRSLLLRSLLGASGEGAAAGELDALLRAARGGAEAPRASTMMRRPSEPELLAARPTDEAEAMVQWRGENAAGGSVGQPDSWHL